MGQTILRTAGVIAFIVLVGCRTYSQTLNIWPGPAPGSENWTQKERTVENTPVGTVVFNVVTPTLTVYLPERTKASGTGVIIAPGGAFVALAIDLEGHNVARWLQERGIAAFVLKYRIIEKKQEGIPTMNMDEAGKYGIADGIQAIKVVRQHAAEWGVSPNRVGFMGFSAGAMVASFALLQENVEVRPNFAAPIYGAPFGVMPTIPAKLPPIFMAWAQDDTVALDPVLKFYEALKSAGDKPEAHIFSSGGHGFGMRKQAASSDHWIDAFYYWLESQGLTRPARSRAYPISRKGGRTRDRDAGKIERRVVTSFHLWVQLQMADDLVNIFVKTRKQQQPRFGFPSRDVLTCRLTRIVPEHPGMIENRRQAAVNPVGEVVGQSLL
ncbi:MAG TPA: alpha/beta hydrolase [Blastocatellia bacterium]|nr:alpha/beta hydrolase [Blastocatellia bacterium]